MKWKKKEHFHGQCFSLSVLETAINRQRCINIWNIFNKKNNLLQSSGWLLEGYHWCTLDDWSVIQDHTYSVRDSCCLLDSRQGTLVLCNRTFPDFFSQKEGEYWWMRKRAVTRTLLIVAEWREWRKIVAWRLKRAGEGWGEGEVNEAVWVEWCPKRFKKGEPPIDATAAVAGPETKQAA